MAEHAKPRTMELIGDQFLAIVWDDGHESIYEGPYLRKHCPCAECRTRREREAAAGSLAQAPPGLSLAMAPPVLVGLEEVGRYAVRLRWSDRHSAGLFEFRLLRNLCPCEACAGAGRPTS
jgi:DUF971 family protein